MQPLGVHEQSQRKLGNPVVGVERVSPFHVYSALRGLEPPLRHKLGALGT
jgi:hypothetical protein